MHWPVRTSPECSPIAGTPWSGCCPQLYLGGGGIFGTPLGVSATFVIVIIIYGAFLEKSGAGRVLMDIATGATGRSRGGPAKASVVGSSLMGMISGTAVANVLTTGTISIPLMKRNGYPPHVAGAVEAVASTGGQLMPPVMGAAAFIMADMIERPYLDIARAAIIPAVLYYVVLFAVVHLEAVKRGIPVLARSELPGVTSTVRSGGHLLLSLPVFVYLLLIGYSVMYAAFWAVVVAIGASFLRRNSMLSPRRFVAALVAGVDAVIPVAVACATAGIIIRRHLADRPRAEVQHPGGDRFRGEPARGPGADDDRLSDPRHGPADRGGVHRTPRCGTGASPLPPVIKLGSQHPVKLIPIPDDVFETLNAKVPPYFRNEIPGGSYKGIPEVVPSYGLANGLVIDADVDEDLVYRMTRAIYENLAGLKGVHPAFGSVTKATVLNGFGAPLHPGALRFYREIEVPGIEEFVNRTAD